MTPRQRQCLDFVAAYITRTGVGPTYDEIAADIGRASRGAAHRMVWALINQGYLAADKVNSNYSRMAKRGIRLTSKSMPDGSRLSWAIQTCREAGYEVYRHDGTTLGSTNSNQRSVEALVEKKESWGDDSQ